MRLPVASLAALIVWPLAAETFDGKVIEDHSGRPLASVELRVAKDGERLLVADLETDGNGRFHAEGISAGDYRVEVSKPNFAPLTFRTRLAAGGRPLLVRLVRFGVIAGKVADPDGRTIPLSNITVMSRTAEGAMQPFGYPTRVDDRGQYRVYNLPPGQYAIAVSYGAASAAGSSGGTGLRSTVGSGVQFYPNNQRPQWFTVAGGEEYTNTDFTIIPTALFKVAGKVEGDRGPFAVALTSVDQPLIPVATQRLQRTSSEFQLEGIPPGSYDLYATGPTAGYGGMGVMLGPEPAFGRVRVQVTGQDVTSLAVPTQKGRSASFLLRAASAKQASSMCPSDATLTLSPLDATGAALDRTVEVNFLKPQILENLAPVHYRLSLSRLGDTCYGLPATADLTGGSDEPIAVTVAPAAAIRGRLTGASGRPQDFAVILIPSGPGDALQVVYPDQDFRFAFGALPPGRYRIAVQPATDSPRTRWVGEAAGMLELDLPGGAPTDIDLPAPLVKKP